MACCKSVHFIQSDTNSEVSDIYDELDELSNVTDVEKLEGIRDNILEKLKENKMRKLLLNQNDDKYEKSILIKAMSIPDKRRQDEEKAVIRNLIEAIILKIPKMIVLGRKRLDYKGLTPVHLAIMKSDKDLLNLMISQTTNLDGSTKGLCADGYAFHDTVMMAGTPLALAALMIRKDAAKHERKLQKEIFQIVLKNYANDICDVNRKGDNIIHTLIKYLHVEPQIMSAQQVKYTVNYILKKSPKSTERKLLTMQNNEKLTPLQLATKRQQYEIFEFIMKHETYCYKESSDGLIDEDVYDITDIETLAVERKKINSTHENIMEESHFSILQMLKFYDTVNAFQFADFLPVKEVIRTKWKFYRKIFWPWFILHFIFMVLLTISAVYRSKLKDKTPGAKVEYRYAVLSNAFVTTIGAVGVFKGFTYSLLEFIRCYRKRFKYQVSNSFWRHLWLELCSPYSNLYFRIWFVVYSLLLIVDFIAAAVSSKVGTYFYENYCLIFAVIVGWYLVMFFIQTIKPFSFFTVLIQRVISDMVKFAVVMTIILVAFSAAMYMIMQGANTDEDDFDGYFKTCIKMLTIMLGIGELSILFSARQPILAVIVFVLFVLLTTILLLNALLAMMSNTCTGLMTNFGGVVANKMHGRLQKLSVILFLEGFLPRICCLIVGEEEEKSLGENSQRRLIWRKSCVKSYDESQPEKNADTLQNHHTEMFYRLLQHVQNRPLKRMSKNKTATTNAHSHKGLQRQVSRRLDITDTHWNFCDNCKDNKETPTARYTQEVVETIDQPDFNTLNYITPY